MVHAITEIARVMAPGGKLIDARPVGTAFDVELCRGSEFKHLGRFARSDEKVRSDRQCDAAIDYGVRRRWLAPEITRWVTSYYYGDDPSEDIGPAAIPESEYGRLRELLEVPGSRLRARYESTLTIYRKPANI